MNGYSKGDRGNSAVPSTVGYGSNMNLITEIANMGIVERMRNTMATGSVKENYTEAAAEIERLRSELAVVKAENRIFADSNAQLLNEVVQLRPDAKRYRWLQSKAKGAVPMVRIQVMTQGQYQVLSGQDLNRRVDEVLAKSHNSEVSDGAAVCFSGG